MECLCLYLFADHLGMAFFKRSNVFGKIALHTTRISCSFICSSCECSVDLACLCIALSVGRSTSGIHISTYQVHMVCLIVFTQCSHALRCNQRISLFEIGAIAFHVFGGLYALLSHLQSKHPNGHRHILELNSRWSGEDVSNFAGKLSAILGKKKKKMSSLGTI